MATVTIKKEVAAIIKDNMEDHPRSNQSGISYASGIQEHCIVQVLEDIEDRVTKKLSPELSSTKSYTSGVLSQPDEFLLNPQVWGKSRRDPDTYWKSSRKIQGTNGDSSQNDPHPEVRVFLSQSSQ